MSGKVVRSSRFRHVYGQAAKKQDCYDNIRITKSSWDSTFCCTNPKFVAIITEAAGGGAFLVLNVEKVGRVDRDSPLVVGHKAAVLDIAWCPHNDHLIASASEDCTVKVWEIPNGGLSKNLSECVADLVAHQRRVGIVAWHPSAHLVLLSAGSDYKVFVWNVATAEILTEIECHTDMIYSCCWNWNGARVVTTCKDKNIRVIDARNGNVIREAKGHQAVKPMRALYLKDGRIFTTGFSRNGERQYALWDQDKLDSPLHMEDLDSSNGVIFPFYDEDTNMIYLCGKGDSAIRYFEYTNEAPYIHYLNTYTTSDPQRGMGYMPKRGLNVAQCEIAKFFKLHNSGLCEVIAMTVPRKSELFQEDLYPDTAAEEAAVSGEEWFGGKDAEPVLMALKDIFLAGSNVQNRSTGGSILRQPSKRITDKTNRESTAMEAPAPAPASASVSKLGSMVKQSHNNNGESSAAASHSSSSESLENGFKKPLNGNHTNGENGHSHQNGATIEKMLSDIEFLQREVLRLSELAKKQENRIHELEKSHVNEFGEPTASAAVF